MALSIICCHLAYAQLHNIDYARRTHNSFTIDPVLPDISSQTWVKEGGAREQFLQFDLGNQYEDYLIELSNVYLERDNYVLKFFSNDPGDPHDITWDKVVLREYEEVIDPATQLPVLSLVEGSTTTVWSNSDDTNYCHIGYNVLPESFNDEVTRIFSFTFRLGEDYRRVLRFKKTIIRKTDDFYKDDFGNTISVWRSGTPNATPIIAAEGIDFTDTRPAQYYWRKDGADMFNCLLAAGFDVYVLDFDRGQVDLKHNANVFQYAIRQVAMDVGKDVIAAGFSMGGIINRFACAEQEDLGTPLPISHMVCIDSPHQGAVVNRDAQRLLFHLEDFLIDVAKKDPESESRLDAIEKIEFQMSSLHSEAALQLLVFSRQDPQGNEIHTNFFNELNSFGENENGYPVLPTTVAVTFGVPGVFNPGLNEEIIRLNWDAASILISDAEFFENELINEGIMVINNSGLSGDGTAIIFNDIESSQDGSKFPDDIADFKVSSSLISDDFFNLFSLDFVVNEDVHMTFMPVNSALDLTIPGNISSSNFDETIISSEMGFHDEIHFSVQAPLLVSMLKPEVLLQNQNILDSRKYVAPNTIKAGREVDPTQAYGDYNINGSADVTMIAGESITFKTGFFVSGNADFLAYIDDVDEDVFDCGEELYQGRVIDPLFDDASALSMRETVTKDLGLNEMLVFPNPSLDDDITIASKLMEDGKVDINLYSFEGKLIKQIQQNGAGFIGENHWKFTSNSLQPGLYIVELKTVNQRLVTRFIKQ